MKSGGPNVSERPYSLAFRKIKGRVRIANDEAE
jgi:hypothetical protein